MTTASIEWHFEQNTALPIVRIRGTTTELSLQPLLLLKAVELIESANKHDGVPFKHDVPQIQKPLMVSFTLIFKNHKCAQDFLKTIK